MEIEKYDIIVIDESHFFDDLIDHSYDNEVDAQKRLQMIIEEIKRLNSIQEDVKKFYIENKERFIKNKQIVDDIKNQNLVNKLFFDLIHEKIEKTSLV